MTTKRTRLSPEKRKEQLLQSALDAFCRNGVDGTTMHQLAEHAGVSYGLFYHYFRSKDEVLDLGVDKMSVLPQIQEFLSQHHRSARDLLLELPQFYLDIMEERRDIVWLIFSESRKRPALSQRLTELAEKFRKALKDYLEARSRHGEIREGTELEIATRVIWSHLFMRFLWIETEPDAKVHLEIILNGLLS